MFTAPAPDVAWCGDMTEIITGEGKLHLATVIDLYTRRILGYAMGAHHDAWHAIRQTTTQPHRTEIIVTQTRRRPTGAPVHLRCSGGPPAAAH